MLYSRTHMATVGIKWLTTMLESLYLDHWLESQRRSGEITLCLSSSVRFHFVYRFCVRPPAGSLACATGLEYTSRCANPLTSIVAIWVQLQSILCQTGLSRHL